MDTYKAQLTNVLTIAHIEKNSMLFDWAVKLIASPIRLSRSVWVAMVTVLYIDRLEDIICCWSLQLYQMQNALPGQFANALPDDAWPTCAWFTRDGIFSQVHGDNDESLI